MNIIYVTLVDPMLHCGQRRLTFSVADRFTFRMNDAGTMVLVSHPNTDDVYIPLSRVSHLMVAQAREAAVLPTPVKKAPKP